MTPNWKPSRTDRKIKEAKQRRELQRDETDAKLEVRRRDGSCRFPLCGCRRLKLQLAARGEVSHQRHKGMGGNPSGDRSTAAGLILLCNHRHQDGAVSRHKGTLRIKPLTRAGMNGPVAFWVDLAAVYGFRKAQWKEVARETAPRQLEPLERWQLDALQMLAEMTA